MPARQAAVRVRALRMAYLDFERTMAMLDRLERLGQRLRSPVIVDVVVMVRERCIQACSPRRSTDRGSSSRQALQ